MRLTRYDDENRYYRPCDYESDKQSTILKLCKKLGQVEDIEDKLGIDLITLLKAQTDGFYVKTVCGIFSVLLSEWKFNLIKKEVHRIQFSDHYYFKDYGKTWALTKEELENE